MIKPTQGTSSPIQSPAIKEYYEPMNLESAQETSRDYETLGIQELAAKVIRQAVFDAFGTSQQANQTTQQEARKWLLNPGDPTEPRTFAWWSEIASDQSAEAIRELIMEVVEKHPAGERLPMKKSRKDRALASLILSRSQSPESRARIFNISNGRAKDGK